MKIDGPTSTYLNPLFLIVWFFIWGICPWSNATPLAQAAEDSHPQHHHHNADGTHHASKGAEHSCSGSISYTKSDFGSDRLLSPVGPVTIRFADCPARLNHPPYFFESTILPRLLTAYYQLYSVYLI